MHSFSSLRLIFLLMAVRGILFHADAETIANLKAGDAAPALTPTKWVQGEAVKEFDKDHVYLLEFWATWCGPCKAAIPHLNDLHTRFKDRGLVVIGQNVWETDEAAVEPFVKSMTGKLDYRIATDDLNGRGKGAMANAWLEAAGMKSIPATFIVSKEGRIAWIGHPMKVTDELIQSILDGKHHPAKPAPAGDNAETVRLIRVASTALISGDWAAAESAISELEKSVPVERRAQQTAALRVDLLIGKGDDAGAATLAEKLTAADATNIPLHQLLAFRLIRADKPPAALLDAAEKISTRANAALNGKDVGSILTLARVSFMKGDQAKAIELQTKAVEYSKPAAQPRMKEFLDAYKAGRLPDTGARRAQTR